MKEQIDIKYIRCIFERLIRIPFCIPYFHLLSQPSCVHVTYYAKISAYCADTKQLAIMKGPFCIDSRESQSDAADSRQFAAKRESLGTE